MVATATFFICLCAAALAGIFGYWISYRFNRSTYAATDRSGEYDGPFGGLIFSFAGIAIATSAVSVASHLFVFPKNAAGFAFLVSLLVGMIAGIIGMLHGFKKRRDRRS